MELREHGVESGLIYPIIVSHSQIPADPSNDQAPFTLEDGARRLAAFELLEFVSIPAIVLSAASGHEAREFIANTEREDWHPLAEGKRLTAMMKSANCDLYELARLLSRTETYLSRRMQLTLLVPSLQEDFFAGRVSLRQAELLSSLSPDTQETTIGSFSPFQTKKELSKPLDIRTTISNSDLLRAISNATKEISKAPFKVLDQSKPGGSCVTCPKSTGMQTTLFAELSEGVKCTDAKCWDENVEFHIAQAAAAGVMIVYPSYHPKPTGLAYPVTSSKELMTIYGNERKCPDTITAVLLPDGKKEIVCCSPTCAIHPRTATGVGSSPAEKRDKQLRKAWRSATGRLVMEIASNVSGEPPEPFLRALSQAALTLAGSDLCKLVHSQYPGAEAVKKGDWKNNSAARISQWIDGKKTWSQQDTFEFFARLAFSGSQPSGPLTEKNLVSDGVTVAADVLGIEHEEIIKAAIAAATPKKKAPKPAKKKAAKKDAKAPAKKKAPKAPAKKKATKKAAAVPVGKKVTKKAAKKAATK